MMRKHVYLSHFSCVYCWTVFMKWYLSISEGTKWMRVRDLLYELRHIVEMQPIWHLKRTLFIEACLWSVLWSYSGSEIAIPKETTIQDSGENVVHTCFQDVNQNNSYHHASLTVEFDKVSYMHHFLFYRVLWNVLKCWYNCLGPCSKRASIIEEYFGIWNLEIFSLRKCGAPVRTPTYSKIYSL